MVMGLMRILHVYESGAVEIKNGDDNVHDDDDKNHNNMSYCDMGLWWERVEEDEGWCWVGDNLIA